MRSGPKRQLHASCRSVLAAAVLLWAGHAHADSCTSPPEESALQTRVLKSELMVAALTCDSKARYNTFVQRFESELVAHGYELRLFFARAHGSAAQTHLDQFITLLANEASLRSIRQRGGYCARAAELFQRVLMINPGTLSDFAAKQPFADSHGVETCTGREIAYGTPRWKPVRFEGAARDTWPQARPPA